MLQDDRAMTNQMRHTMRGHAMWATLLGLLIADAAPTNADPPLDSAIDLQLFEYAVGSGPFMSVNDASTAAPGIFNVDFMVTYLTDPFTVYIVDEMNNEIEDPFINVIESIFAGEISGAYGLTSKLQLGIALPLLFSITGDGLSDAGNMPAAGGFQASGLGDMRLEAKYQLAKRDQLQLAVIGGLTVPTSVGSMGGDYMGDDLPTGRGAIALQWDGVGGKLSIAGNAGIILRKPRDLYASTVGHQLTYGAGAAFRANDNVAIVAELFGRTGLTSLDLDASPLEALAGLRVKVRPTIDVLAGGGLGLSRGIGAPGLRAFVAVGWAPDYRDSDGDGIRNMDDKCPLLAEDRDGFEDSDGCPDLDNDGDKRLDAVDKCPDEAEDLDGFEDDDGCPDLDNDADGIPDTGDRCPDEKEDGLKPYPKDGCPASKRDSDGDGIPDATDKCPLEEEDEDGFQDDDGCPDPDNDGDGIPDEDDKCPLCAEDFNGNADDDGCPEQISTAVTIKGDRMVLAKPLRFDSKDDVAAGSMSILDDIAQVMKARLDITEWMIVVGAKDRSRVQAQFHADTRAASIKTELVARGVNADTLTMVGARAKRDKVAIAIRSRGDAKAKFVCPAHLRANP